VSSSPPRIVIGSALVASQDISVRNFLLLRAIKVVQTHACVLSRTAPIDLLPLMAALIKSMVPSYSPPPIDKKRFDDALARLSAHKPAAFGPDLVALAVEVSSSLDNRASTFNVAVNAWADRVAMLATGSVYAAIQGIAWAGGHASGPPSTVKERVAWVGRNAEARELVVFMVSDEYQEACTRLGLA
jgi:hypothetical protein